MIFSRETKKNLSETNAICISFVMTRAMPAYKTKSFKF